MLRRFSRFVPRAAALCVLGWALGCEGRSDDTPAPKPAADPPATKVAKAANDELPAPPLPSPDDSDELAGPPAPPPDPLHGEVRPGDSLSTIFHRAALPASTALAVAKALETIMDPAAINVGQRFDIELNDEGGLDSFAFVLSPTKIARVSLDDEGAWVSDLEEVETNVIVQEIVGEVESSLWAALAGAGHPPELVDLIVDVFAYDIDFFTATRAGDTVRLLVERHQVDGEFVRYGRVLAGEYAGHVGQVRLFWWQPDEDEEGRYVDADGQGIERTFLKTPLKYTRVSSGFNPARMHPVLHRVKSHQGVDYAAPEGTPVWAAADGTIVFRKKKGGAGNMVILRHASGLRTLYMHLSKFAERQHVGQRVEAKTVIGYVGMTGLATGPHLHFGMQKHGRYVDPESVKSVRKPGVPKKHLRAFARLRDERVAHLETLELSKTDEPLALEEQQAPSADAPVPPAQTKVDR